MENRVKELPVGYRHNGSYVRKVELLRSNGVCEKIFADRLPEKPSTWMGNVLSCSIKDINGDLVAEKFREEYLESRTAAIPAGILNMPFADVHTMLMEIHRTVWKPVVKKQEAICKYCGNKMVLDIDLNRIDFPDEDKAKFGREIDELVVNLDYGFKFRAFGKPGDKRMYEEFDGLNFNRFTFRVPTLKDAIKHEINSDDSILYWRKIAYDCIMHIEAVEDGTVVAELPKEAIIVIGMKLFDLYLDSADLQLIRETLRDELPTIPFYYLEECANPRCKRMTPVALEAGDFFGV